MNILNFLGIFSNPEKISEGVLLFNAETQHPAVYFSLKHLPIDVPFNTATKVEIVRSSANEITIADRIRVPITSSKDPHPSLKGIFHPEVAVGALEYFAKEKLDEGNLATKIFDSLQLGILMKNDNTKTNLKVFRLQDLPTLTTFHLGLKEGGFISIQVSKDLTN